MLYKISLDTEKKIQFIDITDKILEFVQKSKVKEGVCFISESHTTAGLIINEDEEGIKKDFERFFNFVEANFVPFYHNRVDNNACSHLISTFLSPTQVILINNGKLILGKWQNIFFVELDGPREGREIFVKII